MPFTELHNPICSWASSLKVKVKECKNGLYWMFLKLEEKYLQIDLTIYPIALCDKILGILSDMVTQKA